MDSLYFLITTGALSYAFSLRKRFSQEEESRTSSPQALITSLSVYPVKGCRAISVSSCEVTCTGLAFDRQWMIVSIDEEAHGLGRFVSQRECSTLAVIDAAVFINGKDNGERGAGCFSNALAGDRIVLRLSAPLTKSIDVPLIMESTRRVSIWKSTLSAFDQGDDVANWLKDALGDVSSDFIPFDSSKLRLVYTDGNSNSSLELNRPLSSSYLPFGSSWIGHHLILSHKSISFADGYPVLLASEASLKDLNHRIITRAASIKEEDRNERDPFIGLEHPMTRFRPNIVVNGENLVEWEEDSWVMFAVRQKIRQDCSPQPLIMRGIKRCARCMVTTTDQMTGLRGTGDCEAREPLSTLSTFRRSDDANGGIMFGTNVLFEWREIEKRKDREERIVSIGDEIVVIERGSMPPE